MGSEGELSSSSLIKRDYNRSTTVSMMENGYDGNNEIDNVTSETQPLLQRKFAEKQQCKLILFMLSIYLFNYLSIPPSIYLTICPFLHLSI